MVIEPDPGVSRQTVRMFDGAALAVAEVEITVALVTVSVLYVLKRRS